MVVSAIRSAYEVDMHPYRDSSASVKILWYFVPDSAPNLPYPSQFVDTVWAERNYDVQQPVGELQTGHVYSKGFPPAVYPIPGKLPCGTADQWARGASINDPVPSFYPGSFVPTCCPNTLALSDTGGQAEGSPKIYPPACAGGCIRPATVYLTVGTCGFDACGFAGSVIPLNVKNGSIVISSVTWNWVYESPAFMLGGVPRRLAILCVGTMGGQALFYYNDGDPPAAALSSVVTTVSCDPIHFTSSLAYGFPDPCNLTLCFASINA